MRVDDKTFLYNYMLKEAKTSEYLNKEEFDKNIFEDIKNVFEDYFHGSELINKTIKFLDAIDDFIVLIGSIDNARKEKMFKKEFDKIIDNLL